MSYTANPTGTVSSPLCFRGMRSYNARMSVPQDVQDNLIVMAEATRKWRGQRPSMNGCMPVSVDATRPRLEARVTRQQIRAERRANGGRTKHSDQHYVGKAAYARHIGMGRAQHGGWVKTPWGKVPATNLENF